MRKLLNRLLIKFGDDVLLSRSYGVDMDIRGHAESRASWQRGRESLGNVYGYEVNRKD